ncbi:MAG: choice-of-anchor J domain-containing protein, partial [Bacteroidales bacterium]|nr:choice-of-anchor J domain-containing protein [Bacteroidales bacterium]
MKNIIKILAIATAIVPAFMFSGCIQGKYDTPEVSEVPVGDTVTITHLWDIYESLTTAINVRDSLIATDCELYDSLGMIDWVRYDSLMAACGGKYQFKKDHSVFGYITMSDKIGNIYKSAYLQGGADDDKAINLHLLSSGGVYEGDYVRVNLKGLVLSDYSGMIQLDSVHVDNNIVKLETRRFLEPELVDIENIGTGSYVGKLVKFRKVQFQQQYVGQTYADKEGQKTVNTYIEDELGNTMIVRTSGYANFAGDTLPTGSGSLVAIVSRYNTEYQLFIRNTNEVQLTGRRFGDVDELFENNFDASPTGEFDDAGWQNNAVQGSAKWMCQAATDGNILSISGNNGEQNETWLITPEIALQANSYLSFKTRMLTAGNTLTALISTDGTNWTQLPANIASSTDWAISGDVSLAQYSGNIRIAFKFESPV